MNKELRKTAGRFAGLGSHSWEMLEEGGTDDWRQNSEKKKRDAQIGTAFLQVRLCMYIDALSVHSNIGRRVLLASFMVSLVVKNPPAKAKHRECRFDPCVRKNL